MPDVKRTVKSIKIACSTVVLIALTIGLSTAQFVEFDVVDGSSELTGAVPASNTFHEDVFWDIKSNNLSRAGFEDGTIHPYMVYPHWYEAEGAEADVIAHDGHDSALKCSWTSEAKNPHFELRGFSNARKELWWSFDLFVPEVDPENPDAPSFPDDQSTVISQIWHKGVGPMMVAIKINQSHLKVMNHGGPSANMREDIPRGEWNRVVLQVIPSLAGNGAYRLWYGGEKVIEKSGIRVASAGAGEDDFTDEDELIEGQYMDPWFGIYKASGNDDRTLFFDHIISYAAGKDQHALRVEAENYDRYEDQTDGNQGADDDRGGYRPDEPVDIGFYAKKATSFGYTESCYYVGWTEADESLAYDIEIPEAGAYRFDARVASSGGEGRFTISLENDNNVSTKLGNVSVPDPSEDDASEVTFTTVHGPVVSLEPGDYTVRLNIKEGGFKLDWWEAKLR